MPSFTILLRVSSCLSGEKMVSYLIFVLTRKMNKKWGKYAYFHQHVVPTEQENR